MVDLRCVNYSLYCEVTQLYICIHSFLNIFFSIMVYDRILNISVCSMVGSYLSILYIKAYIH